MLIGGTVALLGAPAVLFGSTVAYFADTVDRIGATVDRSGAGRAWKCWGVGVNYLTKRLTIVLDLLLYIAISDVPFFTSSKFVIIESFNCENLTPKSNSTPNTVYF